MARLAVLIVFLIVVGAFGVCSGVRHRRHHHRRHDERQADLPPSVDNDQKKNATDTLKSMLQTSPKDALIVTKRRYLRKDWCQSQPLIQRIGQDQCLSTTILNRFCYGQCNSFFIPKNQVRNDAGQPVDQRVSTDDQDETMALGEAGIAGTAKAFRSCAVCQPKKTSWVTVTLKCPSLVPNIRRRRVLVINQCRCMQPEST